MPFQHSPGAEHVPSACLAPARLHVNGDAIRVHFPVRSYSIILPPSGMQAGILTAFTSSPPTVAIQTTEIRFMRLYLSRLSMAPTAGGQSTALRVRTQAAGGASLVHGASDIHPE